MQQDKYNKYQYICQTQNIISNFIINTKIQIVNKQQLIQIKKVSADAAMNQVIRQYNLTDYTQFRKLQFEYIKIKDENQQLKLRLSDLEILYDETVKQFNEKLRLQARADLERKDKHAQEANQKDIILNHINQLLQILGTTNMHPQRQKKPLTSNIVQSFDHLRVEVEHITREHTKATQTIRQLLRQIDDKEVLWNEREDKFSDEIAGLQIDLKALEKLQGQLHQENQKLIRECQEYQQQIKSYKVIALQARQKSPSKSNLPQPQQYFFAQQDSNFTSELLGYQKQLLCRVFNLVIDSFKSNDIEICLRNIYKAFEDVANAYREKLQVQYDLQDLECQYQKKKGLGSKEALVQLRRQINSFRKELFSQKQLLQRKQLILQEKIKDLSGQTVHDNRLKNFTVNLQSKYRKQKVHGQSDFQNNSSVEHQILKMSTLQFKHTMNTDQLVRQMIQKDRENLQKMLKQTRNQYKI